MFLKSNVRIYSRLILILTCALSQLSSISSQINESSKTKDLSLGYKIEHFTEQDGLSNSRTKNTILLNERKIAIHTKSSIDLFDGTNFKQLIHFDSLGFAPSIIRPTSSGNILAINSNMKNKSSPFLELILINSKNGKTKPFITSIPIEELINISEDSNTNLLFSFRKKRHFIEKSDTLQVINIESNEFTTVNEYNNDYILGNSKNGILYNNLQLNKAYTILENFNLRMSIYDPSSKQTYFKATPKNKIFSGKWDYVFDHEKGNVRVIKKEEYLDKAILITRQHQYPINLGLDYFSKIDTSIKTINQKFPLKYSNISPDLMTLDYSGNLWFSMYYGLIKVSKRDNYFHKSAYHQGVSFKEMYEFDNLIYASTFSGQIEISIDLKNTRPSYNRDIKIITGNLKIGNKRYVTNVEGDLFIFDTQNKLIQKETIYDQPLSSFDTNILEKKSDNELFIINDKNGLYLYNIPNNTPVFKKEILSVHDLKLYGSHTEKNLMVCTNKGLVIIDTSSYEVTINNKYGPSYAITPKSVKENTYWHATKSGLYILDQNTRNSELFFKFDSQDEATITKIIVYGEYLILPSFNGLHVLNTHNKEIRTFTTIDGLPHNEFNFLSSLLLNNGDIALGTVSGLAIFSPGDICNDLNKNNVALEITNAIDVTSNSTKSLDNNWASKKTIEFDSDLINKQLIFRHPDYRDIKGKTIRYSLSEIGKNNETWITNDKLSLELSRRDYGTYELSVEALDPGKNVIGTAIYQVIYKKPFTRSFAFYLLFILSSLLLSYLLFLYQKKRLINQNITLEKLVEERSQELKAQNKKLTAIRKSQNYLFGVIAHDLRAPINTLRNLSGKVSYLINKEQPERILEISNQLESKVTYISKTVDDLLEWSLLETNIKELEVINFPLDDILIDLPLFFSTSLERKEIALKNNIPPDIKVTFDRNALLTILRNLVGNAIKFSTEKSNIILELRQDETYIEIDVINSGQIFKRKTFNAIVEQKSFQSQDGTDGEIGFGLGLQIIHGYLNKMNGKISLSKEESPTILTIKIPTSKQISD